jgi:hypothetical protein
VVSMPSWELFEQQSQEYRESVIPRPRRARLGGAGFPAWLEDVCGIGRADHRHEDLRVFHAAEGPARDVRLHAGGHGEGSDGAGQHFQEERVRR